MVNQDLMWGNIREEAEATRSPEAIAVIRKFIMLLPSILRDKLDDRVTLEGWRGAQLAIDEYLLQSKLPKELAIAESQHPSISSGQKRSADENEETIKSQLRRWIILDKENIEGMDEWRNSSKFDNERRLPEWSREQQVLYKAGVPMELVKLHASGKLTFRAVLETSATALFPHLPLGRSS